MNRSIVASGLAVLLLVGCSSDPKESSPSAVCTAGQSQCGGTCVDTTSSQDNCGVCGNVCASGLTCQSAQCVCPPGDATCAPAPPAVLAFGTLPRDPTGWTDSAGAPIVIELKPTGKPGTIYECRTGPASQFTPTTPAWKPCDGASGTGTKHAPVADPSVPEGTYRTEYRYKVGGETSPAIAFRFYAHASLNNVATCPRPGQADDGPHFTDQQYFDAVTQWIAANSAADKFPTTLTFPTPGDPFDRDAEIFLGNPWIKIPFKQIATSAGMSTVNLTENPKSGWPAAGADYVLHERSLRHKFVLDGTRTMLLARRQYVHPQMKDCVDHYSIGSKHARDNVRPELPWQLGEDMRSARAQRARQRALRDARTEQRARRRADRSEADGRDRLAGGRDRGPAEQLPTRRERGLLRRHDEGELHPGRRRQVVRDHECHRHQDDRHRRLHPERLWTTLHDHEKSRAHVRHPHRLREAPRRQSRARDRRARPPGIVRRRQGHTVVANEVRDGRLREHQGLVDVPAALTHPRSALGARGASRSSSVAGDRGLGAEQDSRGTFIIPRGHFFRRPMRFEDAASDEHRLHRQLDRLAARATTGRRADALADHGVRFTHLLDDRERVIGLVRRAVADASYRPSPARASRAFLGGKFRELARVPALDHLVHGAVAEVLSEWSEPLLSPNVYSYRAGRSGWQALRAVARAVREHRRARLDPTTRGLYVLRSDVRSYTDTIPIGDDAPLWHELRDLLGIGAEDASFAMLKALVRPEVQELDGTTRRRDRGILFGLPTTTAIANLYLRPLDLALERIGGTYARFGDDVLFASEERERVREAMATLERVLEARGLAANRKKLEVLFWNGAARPAEAWPEARAVSTIVFLGAAIGWDGTIALPPAKWTLMLRDLQGRVRRSARLLAGAPAPERAKALAAVVNAAFDVRSELSLAHAPIVEGLVSDRAQLRQLDYLLALWIRGGRDRRARPPRFPRDAAAVATARGGPRLARRRPESRPARRRQRRRGLTPTTSPQVRIEEVEGCTLCGGPSEASSRRYAQVEADSVRVSTTKKPERCPS